MWSIDPTLDLIAKAVDVAALRHAVHAGNVANADVAGYRRLEVTFAPEELASGDIGALGSAELKAVAEARPEVVVSADANVRLDVEMAQMSQNAMRYQALLGAFERTIGLLRTAARDGRGEG